MSVLRTPEAVPSRVAAVAQYLGGLEGQPVPREELEQTLSPQSLRGDRKDVGNIIRSVISECIKMGLVTETSDGLQLVAQACCRGGHVQEPQFGQLLIDLFSDDENQENHDLCRAIAWFTWQDPALLNGSYEGIRDALRGQIGEDRLGITADATHGDFYYWSRYLGFAWSHSTQDFSGIGYLVPDPSAYVMRALRNMTESASEHEMTIRALIEELSGLCPFFQFGRFGSAVAAELGRDADRIASPSLSFALLRSQRAGRLDFRDRSDGERLSLSFGDVNVPVTHAILRAEGGNVSGP